MEEEKKSDDLKEFISTARTGRRNALTDGESKEDPTSQEIAKKMESMAIEETKQEGEEEKS